MICQMFGLRESACFNKVEANRVPLRCVMPVFRILKVGGSGENMRNESLFLTIGEDHGNAFQRWEINVGDKYPQLTKKLPALRPVYFETLPASPGQGYETVSDGFTARFLPGRNIVVVETRLSKWVLQTQEWELLKTQLLALWLQIDLEAEKDQEHARAAGLTADDFLCAMGVNMGVKVE